MTSETSEDDAAFAGLAVPGDTPADRPEPKVFLAISAAMVAYKTRNHRALVQGDGT
ncbi:hypothetical protein [Bosea sp. (in: a-proteobacteria)]|uniref:hypothetical protein n=1 Tax=Bosea sp. (in: a-proteobacteria) TaxID=1871050 RepID=UPI002B49B5C5|nr:hypothetical protein [Bosea sp. (in: a-proteobacteria)]WRH56442.1 MAG: hypothetical protein RSE11_15500 [Bosea sp. (in: a-proteobacteria)]